MNWYCKWLFLILALMMCAPVHLFATDDCATCEEEEDETLVNAGWPPCKPQTAGTAIDGEDCKECNGQGGERDKPAGTAISGEDCKECDGQGGERNKPVGTVISGEDCKECDGAGGELNKPAGTAIAGEDCKECDGNGGERNKPDGPIYGNPCQKCANGMVVNEPAGTAIAGEPCKECDGQGGEQNKSAGTAIAGEDCKECDGQGGERNKPVGTVISGEDCKECDGAGGELNKPAGTAIAGEDCKECDGNGGERNKPDGPIYGNPCQKCVNGVVVNEPAGTAIAGEPCKECDGQGGEQNKSVGGSLTPLNLKSEYCKCDPREIQFMVDNDTCCPDGTFIPAGTIIDKELSLSPCGPVTEHFTYECLSVDVSYVVLKKEPTKPNDPSAPSNENGFGSQEEVASMGPCGDEMVEPEPYHYCAPGVRVSWSWEKSIKYVEEECKSWNANLSGNINISASADWSVAPYTFVWKDNFDVGTLCQVPSVPGSIDGVTESKCEDFIKSIADIVIASGGQVFASHPIPTGKCCEIYIVCFWKKQADVKAEQTVTSFTRHEYRGPIPSSYTVYFPSNTAEADSGWRDTNDWTGDIGSPGYECN